MTRVIGVVAFGFLLTLTLPTDAFANQNLAAFEARRDEFLAANATLIAQAMNGVIVDDTVRNLVAEYSTRSQRQANPIAIRILFQFPNSLSDSYRAELTEYYRTYFTGELIGEEMMPHGVSPNQVINEMYPMYIYCEHYPDLTVRFSRPDGYAGVWPAGGFSYEDRTYTYGNLYNGLEISRDAIYFFMEHVLEKERWTTANDWAYETDNRNYAHAQVMSTQLVRDLAQDPLMQRKADMMFHFWTLNNHLDISAKHWGGSLSPRDYYYRIEENDYFIMAWALFGKGIKRLEGWGSGGMTFGETAPFAVPDERPFSELLLDIGSIADEAVDYWYYQLETNAGHDNVWNTDVENAPKWTYVTNFYNLGGSRAQWELCIRPPRRWYRWEENKHTALRFWMNDNYNPDCTDCPEPWPEVYAGKRNVQYRNAMLIIDAAQLNIRDNYWEVTNSNVNMEYFGKEHYGEWSFYRTFTGGDIVASGLDEVEVVVAIEDDHQALEVATIGVDYPSFEAFKDAILANADVFRDGEGQLTFITSKGLAISEDGDYDFGLVNGQPIWAEYGHPLPDFPWMKTVDKNGHVITDYDWDTKTLKLSLHGRRQILDFANWTMRTVPPVPRGLAISPE